MALVNRTNFIDLLFPAKELEALGNRWEEPALKRRKLDERCHQQRNSSHGPNGQTPSHHNRIQSHKPVPVAKSTTKPPHEPSTSRPSSKARAAVVSSTQQTRSPLPSFIDPHIMRNFLQHLHPSDRSRYCLPTGGRPRMNTVATNDGHSPASSPASLTTDTTHDSPDPPTPSEPGIYESLNAGPYTPLLNGLRITSHERSLMEDLLAPEAVTNKPSQSHSEEVRILNSPAIAEQSLETFCPPSDEPSPYRGFAIRSGYLFGDGDEEDEEQEQQLDQQQWDGSVDDFFNLEEASERPNPVN